MPSYNSYKRQMSVLDKDDDIVSWITVRGNHIPIRKGQSKEDAVKSFLEKKGGNTKSDNGMSKGHKRLGELNKKEANSAKSESSPKEKTVQSAMGHGWTGVILKKEGQSDWHSYRRDKEDALNFIEEAKKNGYKESDIQLVGFEEEKVELTDLQGKKYTATKQELKEAGTSKFGLDPKGIKPAILEPKGGSEIKSAFEDFPKFKIKKDYAVAENGHKRVVVEKHSDGVIGVTTETDDGELLNREEFKSWESAATYANKQRISHKILLGENK